MDLRIIRSGVEAGAGLSSLLAQKRRPEPDGTPELSGMHHGESHTALTDPKNGEALDILRAPCCTGRVV